ncbi:MAG: glycosyltransferase [Blautia sp.]|nr:glycosyltransferase [Blautia sp.]
MKPKVSVIVPVYNAEKVFATCLDTLIMQTYVNKEIIIVDDGSTDNTGKICDQYQIVHDCIKVIHQRNAGVSAARNTALDYSSGEYVVFVDSDDTVDPQYIEELMKWSEYDFVTAGYYWQKPDLSWDMRKFEDIIASKRELKSYPSRFMGKYYFGSPWATLMKKKIIDSHKLRFDEKMHCGEDILFIFQYLKYVNTIKILPSCGYWYHYYPNSLVNTSHSNFWKWKIRVENEIFNYFQPYNKEEQIALLNRIFDVLRDLLRDYSTQMSNQELFNLYQHPFFQESILYKKSSGTFKERILIFAMQRKNYKIYIKIDKIYFFYKRIINKLKRMFSRYTR